MSMPDTGPPSWPTNLLVATNNPGKIREYKGLLSNAPFELVSLADLGISHEVDEAGLTFRENAWLKASEYAALAGVLTLADDAGLEVDALGGEPGVRSARYGGDTCRSDEERVALLLRNLEGVPWEKRTARFRCVVTVAEPYGRDRGDLRRTLGHPAGNTQSHTPRLVAALVGSVAGMIQYGPEGNDGFGYDPVFFLPSFGKTMAQLSLHDKNQISHRADAAAKAIRAVTAYSRSPSLNNRPQQR